MVAKSAASSVQSILSTWTRDYRLGLALVVAGSVMVVGYFAFGGWANSIGNYRTTFGAGLAIYLMGTAGSMLILLAGTVAYYHWRGLRLTEGNA